MTRTQITPKWSSPRRSQNAIDVGASKIDINLEMDMHGDASISFYNNGPGMNSKQFEDYHVISRSSKIKGKGIGFAGVGAKVYLAAWPEKTKIHTETSDGRTAFASDMYIRDGKLKHVYVEPKIKKAGTLYEVSLKGEDYQRLTRDIHHIFEDVFTPALMGGLKIYVNNTAVKPWAPDHDFRKTFTVTAKGRKYRVTAVVGKEDVPPKKQYFQYHVSGKIIMSKKPDWSEEVRGRYRDRVYAFVDATELSDFLDLSKTSFKSVKQADVAAMIKETGRRAYDLLKKEGFVEELTLRQWEQTPLTKFFQKLFKDPEFSWLNPDPRGGAGGARTSAGGGGGKGSSGDNGKGQSARRGGGGAGKYPADPPRGGGVFSITYRTNPDDPRDGWLDPSTNQVVINLEHPLLIKYENNVQARNQRVGSIITSVLIKNASSNRSMEPREALDLHTKILTMAKDVMW